MGLEGKKNEHPISEICPRFPNQWQPSLPMELETAAKERGTKFSGNSPVYMEPVLDVPEEASGRRCWVLCIVCSKWW